MVVWVQIGWVRQIQAFTLVITSLTGSQVAAQDHQSTITNTSLGGKIKFQNMKYSF